MVLFSFLAIISFLLFKFKLPRYAIGGYRVYLTINVRL
jgi:hypothetical protein